MQLKEVYQARRIEFLELYESEGWRLKIYSLHYAGPIRPWFVSVHQGRSYDLAAPLERTSPTQALHEP